MTSNPAASPPDDQADVVAFLASGAAFGCAPGDVEHRETHGARVFLGPAEALKIKRAVRFPYMDLSTRERRHAMIEREYALNLRHAPALYLGVVPITREAGGDVAVGGDGPPVEWALRMRRFDEAALLSRMAARGPLDAALMRKLAAAIMTSHASAPIRVVADGDRRMTSVVDDVIRQLRALPHTFAPPLIDRLAAAVTAATDRARTVLRTRGQTGFVRHCHGDLHLNNIVLWNGEPVAFDALEFSDDLATIDTLYDLAFLLMDLDHARQRPAANHVLNRYLWLTQHDADLDGLAALPLLIGTRSLVRALVTAQAAGLCEAAERAGKEGLARVYLDHAVDYLTPPPPRLVAVGGLSGTGKSTLAAALAPSIGASPGAVHLRSDLERKAMFGVGELDRLPPEHYTPATAAAVYERLLDKSARVLKAGHAVIVDAVFLRGDERERLATLARQSGVPFTGLWLDAPADTLRERVDARTNDASDATTAVVDLQAATPTGDIPWSRVDAGGAPSDTLKVALKRIG